MSGLNPGEAKKTLGLESDRKKWNALIRGKILRSRVEPHNGEGDFLVQY